MEMKKVVGREHPDTLTSVYGLAFVFDQQQCYVAALELYQRSYEGYVKVLGVTHPTTVACLSHYEFARKWGGEQSSNKNRPNSCISELRKEGEGAWSKPP